MHIQNPRMRAWVLYNWKIVMLPADQRGFHRDILHKLYEAETFENFLHKIRRKRFSLEAAKP